MSEDAVVLSGGCLCGRTRYQATAMPFASDYCHCRQCQVGVGSVITQWMDFKVEQVVWSGGPLKEFASSDKVRRGFCPDCGSSITYRHLDHGEYITMSVASLDNPELVSPDYHIYTESQVSWLKVADEHPRYAKGRSDG
ncbi:GFA family protein [Paraferrimonas sedimenticola]|uniref:Aldehyde-activating protein n=1 Tax=Paraferrimonas sedimenticola TaxID=375674 RepID=A0AA37W0J3_9GAMM|nr:GFA family protein [Paraferrimonas sedimenticola]GLP95112.1 aldehyde-activating protein [Paraferrimonas sedimenticola]